MIIDYDKNGVPVTDEDVERWSRNAEKLDFSEFRDVGDCIYGKISPISQVKKTVSITLPVSTIKEFDNLASKQGCSRSDVMRSFMYDGLLRASAQNKSNVSK